MSYPHGIRTNRGLNVADTPEQASYNVQVAVGTAPVNLLENPSEAVNVPILCRNRGEAFRKLGQSLDYRYSLIQTIYASFSVFAAAPVILINVLDPSNVRHTEAVAEHRISMTGGKGTVEQKGILMDTLEVSAGATIGVEGTDYVASFDDNGYVVVAATPDGAFKNADKLKLSFVKLNPEGVTAADVIGGLSESGKRTGIELIDEIYSRLKVMPGILSAPGFSSNPAVAAALEAKAELSGDFANGIAVVDIDVTQATKPSQVEAAKAALGVSSRWVTACWPKVLMGGASMYMSAAVAALLQRQCNENDDFPQSQDNKPLGIDGTVLADGSELFMMKSEADDYVVGKGVVTAIYMNGWKCWGSNTTRYPLDADKPNERFTKNVMAGNYLENRFKAEFLSRIGTDASYALVDSIVTDFNVELNAMVPKYLAGAEVVFDKSENPDYQIQQGHFLFRTRYADYTPTEYIENTFTWDVDMLSGALSAERGEE